MKKSSPHLERVPRLARRSPERQPRGPGAIAALLVVAGAVLAAGGMCAHQRRIEEAQQVRAAASARTESDAQERADRTAQGVREARLALLAALNDPQYVTAHPEAAVAALERLAASRSKSDDADFRERLDAALSAARAHVQQPVTTAQEVWTRPRN